MDAIGNWNLSVDLESFKVGARCNQRSFAGGAAAAWASDKCGVQNPPSGHMLQHISSKKTQQVRVFSFWLERSGLTPAAGGTSNMWAESDKSDS